MREPMADREFPTQIMRSLLPLGGCGPTLDEMMWECELQVQRENAGRSAEAIAKKAHAIEVCMGQRGYRLYGGNCACQSGSQHASCYVAR
jgi:hypothetical protein